MKNLTKRNGRVSRATHNAGVSLTTFYSGALPMELYTRRQLGNNASGFTPHNACYFARLAALNSSAIFLLSVSRSVPTASEMKQ